MVTLEKRKENNKKIEESLKKGLATFMASLILASNLPIQYNNKEGKLDFGYKVYAQNLDYETLNKINNRIIQEKYTWYSAYINGDYYTLRVAEENAKLLRALGGTIGSDMQTDADRYYGFDYNLVNCKIKYWQGRICNDQNAVNQAQNDANYLRQTGTSIFPKDYESPIEYKYDNAYYSGNRPSDLNYYPNGNWLVRYNDGICSNLNPNEYTPKVVSQPVVSQPVVSQPVVSNPVTSQPTTSRPTSNPVTSQPTTQYPTTQSSQSQQWTTQYPTNQQTVTQNSVDTIQKSNSSMPNQSNTIENNNSSTSPTIQDNTPNKTDESVIKQPEKDKGLLDVVVDDLKGAGGAVIHFFGDVGNAIGGFFTGVGDFLGINQVEPPKAPDIADIVFYCKDTQSIAIDWKDIRLATKYRVEVWDLTRDKDKAAITENFEKGKTDYKFDILGAHAYKIKLTAIDKGGKEKSSEYTIDEGRIVTRDLSLGCDPGLDVKTLHEKLNYLGLNTGLNAGEYVNDYLPKTDTAVKALQMYKGQNIDGVVGEATWTEINELVKKAKADPKEATKISEELNECWKDVNAMKTVLSYGMMDNVNVAILQKYLLKLGLPIGNSSPEGDFGEETKISVLALQRGCSKKEDGIVGKETWECIMDLIQTKLSKGDKKYNYENGNWIRDKRTEIVKEIAEEKRKAEEELNQKINNIILNNKENINDISQSKFEQYIDNITNSIKDFFVKSMGFKPEDLTEDDILSLKNGVITAIDNNTFEVLQKKKLLLNILDTLKGKHPSHPYDYPNDYYYMFAKTVVDREFARIYYSMDKACLYGSAIAAVNAVEWGKIGGGLAAMGLATGGGSEPLALGAGVVSVGSLATSFALYGGSRGCNILYSKSTELYENDFNNLQKLEAPVKLKKIARNMDEFFNLDFGKSIKNFVKKTSGKYNGSSVWKVTDKNNASKYLTKGDRFYIDTETYDHIEVFNSSGEAKVVLDMDGNIIKSKTDIAIKQKRIIPNFD